MMYINVSAWVLGRRSMPRESALARGQSSTHLPCPSAHRSPPRPLLPSRAQLQEMALVKPNKPEEALEVGSSYEFVIVSREDENGQLMLSRRRILFSQVQTDPRSLPPFP